jgi:hypothetical protein
MEFTVSEGVMAEWRGQSNLCYDTNFAITKFLCPLYSPIPGKDGCARCTRLGVVNDIVVESTCACMLIIVLATDLSTPYVSVISLDNLDVFTLVTN